MSADLALRAYTAANVSLFVEVTSEYEDFGFRSLGREPPGAPSRTTTLSGFGITLLPAARGRSIGTWAQRELARLIFAYTPVNRVEASTDVTNIAEQRSLAKPGSRGKA